MFSTGYRKLIIGLALLQAGVASAFTGTEGASFLDIPVGGRPAAMGNAYSALAVDAYAPISNPGGLGFLANSQLAAMHLDSIQSISYEFASFVHPFSVGHAFSASAQYLRPGDTPSLDINGNSAGSFSGSFLAASLGYGQMVSHNVSLGLVGKMIREKIAGYDASAYAADAGAMFQPLKNLRFGATVTNLGSKINFIDHGDPLPTNFRLGTAYGPISTLTLALQGSYSRSGLASAQTGVEWNVAKLLFLRAGYTTETIRQTSPVGSATAGLTAGMGLKLADQQFDYAWVPTSDLGNAQYFSMVFQWGSAGQPRAMVARAPKSDDLEVTEEKKYDEKVLRSRDRSMPEFSNRGLHP